MRRAARKSITESKASVLSQDSLLDNENQMEKIMRKHQEKMDKQTQMHNETLKIQNMRLAIETTRSKREEELQLLQVQKLKSDMMKTINDHNYDTLQKRMELKRNNNTLMEQYLDTILPFMSINME